LVFPIARSQFRAIGNNLSYRLSIRSEIRSNNENATQENVDFQVEINISINIMDIKIRFRFNRTASTEPFSTVSRNIYRN